MYTIKGNFVSNPQENQSGTGNANCQAGNIEKAECFVFPKASQGCFKIVPYHGYTLALTGKKKGQGLMVAGAATLSFLSKKMPEKRRSDLQQHSRLMVYEVVRFRT
jgi:hypothetical protein